MLFCPFFQRTHLLLQPILMKFMNISFFCEFLITWYNIYHNYFLQQMKIIVNNKENSITEIQLKFYIMSVYAKWMYSTIILTY